MYLGNGYNKIMKTGRPNKEIDLEELKEIMQFSPSLDEVAGYLDCSPDTITRFIKKEFQINFIQFKNRFNCKTKLNLKKTAVERALNGNDKMLTFCLKNMCGWSEKTELTEVSKIPTEELIAEAKAIINEIE